MFAYLCVVHRDFLLKFICCDHVHLNIFNELLINEGNSANKTEEEAQATIGEHISFAIRHLTDLICNHSYVISNIMMMVS